ncbi:MAG TPA: DUF2218 domain-containing protein [Stellaceae bacterium]|nr:DUF2218 domain-containing protein [Stellaceae bacterium]
MAALHSEARVATDLAQRYLTQLCKHFEHRLAVSYFEAHGSIAFPAGTCRLEAEPGCLILRAEAADAETLGQVELTVARHLERFAFRAPPLIAWSRA